MALLPLLEAVVAELEGTAEGTCSAGVEDPQPMVSGMFGSKFRFAVWSIL